MLHQKGKTAQEAGQMEPSGMCHPVWSPEYILTLILQMEMKQYHCFKINLFLLALTWAVVLSFAAYINFVLGFFIECEFLDFFLDA